MHCLPASELGKAAGMRPCAEQPSKTIWNRFFIGFGLTWARFVDDFLLVSDTYWWHSINRCLEERSQAFIEIDKMLFFFELFGVILKWFWIYFGQNLGWRLQRPATLEGQFGMSLSGFQGSKKVFSERQFSIKRATFRQPAEPGKAYGKQPSAERSSKTISNSYVINL